MRPYVQPQMLEMRRHPETGLWCREDGAILMPPTSKYSHFKDYRWTFGTRQHDGYRRVFYKGRLRYVHQLVCGAFNGPAPEGKPFCDHINRIRDDNRSCNIRFASAKMNEDNKDSVDRSVAKYGVRECDDSNAYHKAYHEAHHEERRAYHAAYCAEKKAQGLVKRKGPDGKQGWLPRIKTKSKEIV